MPPIRTISLLLLIAATAAFCAANADGEQLDVLSAKTRIVKIKPDWSSPVLATPEVKNEELNLPGREGKGFAIKTETNKVFVDKDQKGKPDFTAIFGDKSTPFDMTFYYPGGERAKHTYTLFGVKGTLYLKRLTAIEIQLGGTTVIMADDNNNGYFGESFADAVYNPKTGYGCPFSTTMLAGGSLYSVLASRSGLDVKYRLITDATGLVDAYAKSGCATKSPCVIVRGAGRASSLCFDIAYEGGVKIPVGMYKLFGAFYKEVEVIAEHCDITFSVAADGVAAFEWGTGLRAEVAGKYYDNLKEMVFSPPIKVFGAKGEEYRGEYITARNFKSYARCRKADGSTTGGTFPWQMKDVNVDPTNTERMFTNLSVKVPDDAVDVVLCVEVPGVGTAETVYKIEGR